MFRQNTIVAELIVIASGLIGDAMPRIVKLLISVLFTLLLSPNYATSGAESMNNEITVKLNEFINEELNGSEYTRNKSELVKYSDEENEAMKDNPSGARIYLDLQPIYVVSGYDIKSIKAHNNKATAIVAFKRIAKTKNVGILERIIIPNRMLNEIVKYQLINDGQGWLILDPPWPRISKQSIVNYYESKIERYSKFINNPDTSQYQKKQFNKFKKDLAILKELKEGDPGGVGP